MQSQRPFYVPSSFSLSTKKRSPSQTATQLSAVEEGETSAIFAGLPPVTTAIQGSSTANCAIMLVFNVQA